MTGLSRRALLGAGLGVTAAAAAGFTGFELIEHGVIPGKSKLDVLTGACALPAPDLSTYARPGPQVSGTFRSAARNRSVGYTIGYPPGHRPGAGDSLPLVIMLHGEGGDHRTALTSLTPAQAVALRPGGRPLPPMALVTVDGGTGYWHARPGDDPMRMLAGELIPLCRSRGLGRARIAAMGVSMGGYGALLLAEKHPRLITAVAAISPAIWTSYAQARAANGEAYTSAADFAANDAVTHAAALARTPVRLAAGYDDPFYPGARAMAAALSRRPDAPGPTRALYGRGCHDGSFFAGQEPPSLAFVGGHLAP